MSEPRRCKAVRDYAAKNDDEITFKEGDVIFVPHRADGLMWKGVFNGKVGWFPKIYVDDLTVEIKGAGESTRVKAVRAYEAQNEEQLSFPVGAVMFVVGRVDASWFKGVYSGKTGLIPAANVQDASNTETLHRKEGKAIAKEFSGLKCRAVRSHLATAVGQLTFKIGDTVFVPKAMEDADLWQGVSNNEIGLFPRTFVVDVATLKKEELDALIEANKALPEEQEAVAKVEEYRNKAKSVVAARSGSVSLSAGTPSAAAAAAVAAVAARAAVDPVEENDAPPNVADPDSTPSAASQAPAASPAISAPPQAAPTTTEEAPPPPPPSSPPPPSAAAAAAADAAPAPAAPLSEKELKALKKKEAEDEKLRKKEEEKRKKEEEKAAKEAEKQREKEKKEAEKAAAKAAKEAAKKK